VPEGRLAVTLKAVKLACALLAASMVTLHVDVLPLQASPQVAKAWPASGVAARVTRVGAPSK